MKNSCQSERPYPLLAQPSLFWLEFPFIDKVPASTVHPLVVDSTKYQLLLSAISNERLLMYTLQILDINKNNYANRLEYTFCREISS